jgi:F0F1-type ATP synthase membrane subunit b/b'
VSENFSALCKGLAMEILIQLGANKTAIIQFLLFVITISFLTVFVYGPYFRAYDERHKRTKGAEAVAKEAEDEAKTIASIYQTKAREINDTIKKLFEAKRTEAAKLASDMVSTSRVAAETEAGAARKSINVESERARQQIKTISAEISQQLKQKFEGGL